jgi:hypothetical protein
VAIVRSVLLIAIVGLVVSTSPAAAATPRGATVAYLGCSQSNNAVEGYRALGGRRIPAVVEAYSGHTIQVWAMGIPPAGQTPTTTGWRAFWDSQQRHPSTVVWWQLCTRAHDDPALNDNAALQVRAAILRFSPPGTTIYVSAQNDYVAPHVCSITGPQGPSSMRALAAQLVSDGLALAGPDVGNLASIQPKPSRPMGDQTQPDGCHANPNGETQVLGPPLQRFFG